MPQKKQSQRRTTLSDIASAAGVQKMTVSRALNGKKGVSEKVRAKILRIAEELGYQRSSLLSAVMGNLAHERKVEKPTPLVYLIDSPIKPPSEDPYLNSLINSAKSTAAGLGFSLEVMEYDATGSGDKRLNRILTTRGIQGIVINVAYRDPRPMDLDWDRLCAVTTGGRLVSPRGLPRVQSDGEQVMRRMIEEVTARGYRRVGFHYEEAGHRRLGNFFGAYSNDYLMRTPPKRRITPLKRKSFEDSPSDFVQWVKKQQPDVIISDQQNTLTWLAEHGYSLEEFGDIGYASTSLQSLESEVAGLYHEKGLLTMNAVEMVVSNMINGKFGVHDFPQRMLVPSKWVEGESLRPRNE